MSETAREHVANALSILLLEYQLPANPDPDHIPKVLHAVTRRLERAIEELDAGNVAPKMKGVPR